MVKQQITQNIEEAFQAKIGKERRNLPSESELLPFILENMKVEKVAAMHPEQKTELLLRILGNNTVLDSLRELIIS